MSDFFEYDIPFNRLSSLQSKADRFVKLLLQDKVDYDSLIETMVSMLEQLNEVFEDEDDITDMEIFIQDYINAKIDQSDNPALAYSRIETLLNSID